jgi:hypothetical protein
MIANAGSVAELSSLGLGLASLGAPGGQKEGAGQARAGRARHRGRDPVGKEAGEGLALSFWAPCGIALRRSEGTRIDLALPFLSRPLPAHSSQSEPASKRALRA